MCSIKDAERHEALALLYQQEKDRQKAREHFLEAASIYVLQAELGRNEALLKKANECYALSLGQNTPTTFSKQELAQRTLTELQEFQPTHHHHHDTLQEIKEMI